MGLEIAIRVISLILIIWRNFYWLIEEAKNNRINPKSSKNVKNSSLVRFLYYSIEILMICQLLGLKILNFKSTQNIIFLGFLMLVVGTFAMFKGKLDLKENWTHMADYQIRKKQVLITNGIYKYIRNPIYLGFILIFAGVEMIVGSYLILLLIPIFGVVIFQSKKEEKLLEKAFGEKYNEYKKRVKLLIPFIY